MKLYFEIPFIITLFVFSLLNQCLGYIKLPFANDRNLLCNKLQILGTPPQRLKHHDNSGLVVQDEIFHSNLWKEDLVCSFKVEHPPGTNGVLAVIQSLNMRTDESGGCIDFIQFKAKDGTKSNQFCGKLDVVSKMNIPSTGTDTIVYGNSFRTKGHKMYVNISVGKKPFWGKSEKIEFKIVFTAYRNCSEDTLMDLSYKRCTDSSDICIYNGFFNDGLVNCPLAGCVDEGTCSKFISTPKTTSVETKLLVGSISFVIVLFITFLISIWACKKHKVGCFSEQFSQPTSTRPTRVLEMNEQRSATSVIRQSATSAPPIEIDKDLPPKYEELFPDR